MNLIKNDRGFTLMEMMVYVVLAGMLLATAVTAFLAQNKSYNRQDVITEIQQNIRGAFEPMVVDVRFAGLGLVDKSGAPPPFATAEGEVMAVNRWDDDSDKAITLHYKRDVATLELQRAQTDKGVDSSSPAIIWETLAENIEQIRFEYLFDSDPDATKNWQWASDSDEIKDVLFSGTGPDSKALEQIRAVKIIMLGSARPAAFNPTDPGTYNPPLESVVVNWPVTPNSGYKRMMSVIAQCRNNHE